MSRGSGWITPLRTGRAWWPILVAVILVGVVLAIVLGSLRPADDDRAGAGTTAATSITGGEGGVGGAAAGDTQGAGPGADATDAPAVAVTLVEVVDGDTIWVRMPDGSEEKVRYIGIDAPELPHEDSAGERLAAEAKAHNEALLAFGPLRLETDVEPRDEFGRLLAYVWAGDVFVNEEMVLSGYAWAHEYPPNLSRQEQLWSAHDRARAAGAGVWE